MPPTIIRFSPPIWHVWPDKINAEPHGPWTLTYRTVHHPERGLSSSVRSAWWEPTYLHKQWRICYVNPPSGALNTTVHISDRPVGRSGTPSQRMVNKSKVRICEINMLKLFWRNQYPVSILIISTKLIDVGIHSISTLYRNTKWRRVLCSLPSNLDNYAPWTNRDMYHSTIHPRPDVIWHGNICERWRCHVVQL